MGIGKRIEAAMTAANKRPIDVAKHFKITESAVSQWVSKDTGPKSTRLSDLAKFLGTTVDYLITETGEDGQTSFLAIEAKRTTTRPPPPTDNTPARRDAADIPVWASAAAGDGDGAIIYVNDEPIDYIRRSERTATVKDPWAFQVIGDSMLERLAQGDQIIINPAMPLVPMTDCVFVHQSTDGNLYALVKRLLRANSDVWRVRQLNPAKDFDLSRKKWTKAYRIAEIRPRM